MDATQYKDYMNEADINLPLSSYPFLPIEQQGLPQATNMFGRVGNFNQLPSNICQFL